MSSIGSFRICSALIGLLAAASNSQAALVAYEGFDYTANESIAAKAGGGGWSAPWDNGNGTPLPLATTQAASLTGAGVATTGGSFLLGSPPAAGLGTGSATTSQTQRMLSSTLGSNGTTVWMGLLWQNLTTSAAAAPDTAFRETKLVLFSGASVVNGVSGRNGAELVGIGIPHTYVTSPTGASDGYSLFRTTGDSSTLFFTSTGVSTQRGTGTSVFLLAKFDLLGAGGGDTLSLWVNPNLALGEAGLGAAQAQWITPTGALAVDLDAINAVRFAAANDNNLGANGQILVDELRIGTTFNDAFTGILAVPEPSAAALGLLGMLPLLRRSRRK